MGINAPVNYAFYNVYANVVKRYIIAFRIKETTEKPRRFTRTLIL